jgi:hypothetical protein
MSVPDPSREPVLERAMPADAVPGSTIPEDTEAEILLQDGSWAWCRVIGQRKDRHGRWCVESSTTQTQRSASREDGTCLIPG